MTVENMTALRNLLEMVEVDEGKCYKERKECSPSCPFWFAGEFGSNICLTSLLGRRVQRLAFGKQLHWRQLH